MQDSTSLQTTQPLTQPSLHVKLRTNKDEISVQILSEMIQFQKANQTIVDQGIILEDFIKTFDSTK